MNNLNTNLEATMALNPPYERLREAELAVRERRPDAISVRALWTPANRCEIHVEVWQRCEREGMPRAEVVQA